MSVEVQWTDTDPATGEKRFVRVDRFAGVWRFNVRARRRDEWQKNVVVTRDMWETLLESLERRYQRREGVTDTDLEAVRKRIALMPADAGPADADSLGERTG